MCVKHRGGKFNHHLPSLKLTAFASETGWLEDEFPFGFRPIFRGGQAVSFREGSSTVGPGKLKGIAHSITSPTGDDFL